MKFDYNMMPASRFQTMLTNEQLSNKLNIIKCLTEECEEIEGGYLYIRHRYGRVNFIEYRDGKHYGITRNMSRVYELARRDYMLCRIEYLKASAEIGGKRDNGIRVRNAEVALQSLLKKYSDAHLDLRRIIYTKAQYEWQLYPQSMRMSARREIGLTVCEDEAFASQTTFITDGGVIVRTREEQAIGSMMEAMGIAYRYEPLIEIDGQEHYPSFAVMMENKRLVLIEYVKDMSEGNAGKDTVKRLVAYKEANIEIGRDVFLAFSCDTDRSYKLVVLLNQIMASSPGHNNVLSEAVRRNSGKYLKN